MRNIVGSILAALGVAATLVSPWRAWYNGRHGSTFKFWEVFGSGVTDSRSGVMDSVFLVFLVMAVIAVAGIFLRSRALVGFAGAFVLGFTILWMVRQGQAAGELTISSDSRGLGNGVANAFGGGLLMIIGALVMTGRPKEVVEVDRTDAEFATAPRSNAIPANPPAPSAPARPVAPPAERAGTERLSKEEREALGLDQDTPSPRKKQT